MYVLLEYQKEEVAVAVYIHTYVCIIHTCDTYVYKYMHTYVIQFCFLTDNNGSTSVVATVSGA